MDEPKEETISLTEANPEPTDASKAEHVEELKASEDVPTTSLDSEEDNGQSPKEEVKSEEIPTAETVTDEPEQSEEGLTEVSVESENKELPMNVMETVQEPEVLEAVQAPTLDSEEGSDQSHEKEVISEIVPEGETAMDEPKEETLSLIEANPEQVDASKVEHVEELKASEAVQAPSLDSEEDNVQSQKEEVKSEEIPTAETVTDEPKEETIHLTEANLEPVDAFKTKPVEEPEALESVQAPILDSEEGSVQSFEKDVISDNVPEPETVIDKTKQSEEGLTEVSVDSENKELPVNVVETVQEPEVSDDVQALTLDSEEGIVHVHEEEVISEIVPEGETDEPKEQSLPLTCQSEIVLEGETIKDEPKQTAEHHHEVSVESVDASKTEHVQELQETEAEQAATLDSKVVILLSFENKLESEDVPEVEIITDEPKLENEVEPEEKHPVEDVETEHAQETETNTDEGTSMCMHAVPEGMEGSSAEKFEKQILLTGIDEENPDSVIASVADELWGEGVAHLAPSLEIAEALKIESITQDVGVEQAQGIPEVVDELLTLKEVCVSSANEEASNVQVLEPPVLTEDNAAAPNESKHEVHFSEVQVGVTVEKEREFSGTETETGDVEHAVVEHGAVEHAVVEHGAVEHAVVEHSVVAHVVKCDIKAAILNVSKDKTTRQIAEKDDSPHLSATPEIEEETVNEQNKVRLQKVIQHVKEHLPEAGAESLAVNLGQEGIDQPDVATQESEMIDTSEVEDQTETADGDASVLETRDEMSMVLGDIAATGKQATEDLMHASDITPHSDISIHDGKDNAIETLIVPPANAGLVEPQNTGVLLSTGNAESPSSLSIEFQLNVQFGRAVEPASPPPTTERSEPAVKTDVPEVAVQATASTELAADSDSTERAVITTPPVLLDICIQAMGPQFKAGERVTTSRDRATETTQTEKGNRDTQKEEEPAKPKEEDQDVWMDAEEEVDAQEKSPGLRSESEREGTEAGLGQEVEVAPGSEAEERQQEMPKTVKRRETDSEGEDFDIALEHPDTASVAAMERN
ncbi:hypothetical protein EYF80_036469 [Liparis tanakae]|uniref:Uncharacterized protein n=1 Tax=Liparis tanakae TaxID=230148 RepID=A0A4Z2GJ94_9TELE|nr:hypothetical protein EYF80_036469 [Liparis tanakae]